MLGAVYLIYRREEVGSVTSSAVLSQQDAHGRHHHQETAMFTPQSPIWTQTLEVQQGASYWEANLLMHLCSDARHEEASSETLEQQLGEN